MAYVDWDPEDLQPAPSRTDDPPPDPPARRLPRWWWVAAAVLVPAVLGAAVLALGNGGSASDVTTATADFDVDHATLDGVPFGDATWRVRGGLYATQGGAARGRASGSAPAIAYADLTTPADVVTATFAHVGDGSGIVFRYVDERNYWSVVAVPGFGTWNVAKTVRGETSFVANTGNNLASDNTSLSVRLQGATFTVLVDGRASMRVTDGALLSGRGVGLLAAAADQGQTAWTSLAVRTGRATEAAR
jgi:hypothetical protein